MAFDPPRTTKAGGVMASKSGVLATILFAQSILLIVLIASPRELATDFAHVNPSMDESAKVEPPRTLVQANSLLYGTMEHPFATTAPEFKTHLLHVVKHDKNRYTKQDLELMATALRLLIDMAGSAWRLSGKSSRNHGIGTGSCMLHIGADAEYVALALLHGGYFSIWNEQALGQSNHPFFFPDDFCARRRWIKDQLGEKFESILWRYTSLHSGAPERTDPDFWMAALDPNSHVISNEDKNIISFTLCDEVEQYQSYEQLWINNERRRLPGWQRKLVKTFDLLAADPLFSNHTFEAIQEYTKNSYKQTNSWYVAGRNRHVKGMDETEKDFKRIIETAFRRTSYAPHINWAHIPQVKAFRGKRVKMNNATMVLEDWDSLVGWWEGVCCDKGGPCREGASDRALSQEIQSRWSLPESNIMSRNGVSLQCPQQGGVCRGVEEGKSPVMSGVVGGGSVAAAEK